MREKINFKRCRHRVRLLVNLYPVVLLTVYSNISHHPLPGIATVSYSTANAELSSIHFTLVWITIGASSMTLLLMSAERLIVLSYPLTWPFILTKRRTLASIAITWGVSLACGLSIRFSGTPLAMFAVTTLFELAILTVVVLHTIIFGYLRKWPAPAQALDEPQNKKTHRRLEHVSQSNATTVLLILVVIFIFTVLPTIVVLQLFAAYWMGFVPASSFEGLAQSHHYLHPIELLNFVANPIVYAWRLKQYRKALGETFATFKQRLCSFGLDHRNTATKRMMK